jgi:hypothetical protein
MTDPTVDALLEIQGRHADDGDKDLLALLTADATSRVVAFHDQTTITSYEMNGAKHSIQTVP